MINPSFAVEELLQQKPGTEEVYSDWMVSVHLFVRLSVVDWIVWQSVF